MSKPTHRWTRIASAKWQDAWEERLRFLGPSRLALITWPDSRALKIEAYTDEATAKRLVARFGGRATRMAPHIWSGAADAPRAPISIRGKLKIFSDEPAWRNWQEGGRGPAGILIPAGMAFGTGEHATTATCLRMLCDLRAASRDEVCDLSGLARINPKPSAATCGRQAGTALGSNRGSDSMIPYSPPAILRPPCPSLPRAASRDEVCDLSGLADGFLAADLGCGSGILAIAAERLGAKRVDAIDNDPAAVRTAKANVRANHCKNVRVARGSSLDFRPPAPVDVVLANLYSELLAASAGAIARALRPGGTLIFSGVLVRQFGDVVPALEAAGFVIGRQVVRGKWCAAMASIEH